MFMWLKAKLFYLLSIKPLLHQQQYQSFPLPWFELTGWLSGTREPVLVHKNYEIVALVVNEQMMLQMLKDTRVFYIHLLDWKILLLKWRQAVYKR